MMDQGDITSAKTAIWAQELAIYSARAKGDLHFYISQLAEGYRAWPPQKPAPIGKDGLASDAAEMERQGKEILDMELTDFTLNGDTAIIYYNTHRTALPDGTPTDQKFQTIHVWVFRDGGWKIFGGMARKS